MPRTSVENLLARTIGIDPERIGRARIARAATDEAARLGAVDLADYAARLVRARPLLDRLIERVVVHESWFFRDEGPFATLRAWAEAHRRDPDRLRILSAPCADGEEPYSIAITLLEAGVDPARFEVVGLELSDPALARARRARFESGSMRGLDPAIVARWFDRELDAFSLKPAVRAHVRFERGNLIEPDCLRDEPRFDVIFCRNLLIYLHDDARRRAVAQLDRLLKPDGLLFVGHADPFNDVAAIFESVGDPASFAYRRARPVPKAAQAAAVLKPAAPTLATFFAAIPRARTDVEPPRADLPAPAPVARAAAVSTAFAEVEQLMNAGRIVAARQACEAYLRANPASAPGFHLSGTIHLAAGDDNAAEAMFAKAVYLDPRHDEALLSLALLAERRGDRAASESYRRRARKAHERKDES
ncbi:MAG: methyltransferase domain-containing protein [Planctomycetota bacterium]|nr:methyltransferase domain-containing protein [Planctomycetota bacterium]